MPFIPVPSGIQAELRMTLDNQQIENTLWFHGGAAVDAADLTTLATNLESWWRASYAPFVTTAVQLREVYVTDQSTQEGAAFSRVPATAATGGAPGNYVPSNSAFCVTFRTDVRGRSGRGRNYISGIQAGNVVGNTLNGTIVQMIVDAYEQLLNPSNTGGLVWSIASRRFNNQPRASGLLRPVVSVAARDGTMDSQRRRLPGRGA